MKRYKVLIVDDEVIIARALSVILERNNYDICTLACTGEDAIKITEEEKPDIILLDISLSGGIDGVTAGKIIRDRYNTPIIYVSGFSYEKVRRKIGNLRPFEFLNKPTGKEEILKSIELGLQNLKP